MLKTISCSAFVENGLPRPQIKLRKGLNSIVGVGSNSNSIGKSTLLMIIDFCFGGEDYATKEQDTIKNIGHHNIEFEFEFDGQIFKFERNTKTPNQVVKWGSNKEKILISIYDFRDWLVSKYKLNHLDLTFRQTVSRFFRIYNRGTHNELRPLNATVREDDKTGIISILKLFQVITDLESLLNELNELKENEITYKNLKKLNVGNITSTKKEYEENELLIDNLKTELENLKKDNELGALDVGIVEIEQKNDLIVSRKRLRTEKRKLEIEKEMIKLDKELDPISLARNIEKLKKFFPNVEFLELEKIEQFHKDIKIIINAEVRDNNNKIDDLVYLMDEEIKELNEKIKMMKNTPSIPDIVIKRYSELESEIKRLNEANENFVKKENNRLEFKAQEEHVRKITLSKTEQLSSMVNNYLFTLNSTFFPGTNSPTLLINGLNSYQFYVPYDTGTGARYRAVITFDMVVLKHTNLPAIAHDSVMIVNIDEEKRNSLFNLYKSEAEKQIFVAYDISNITDVNTQKILNESSIIQLSEGGRALFGKQWNINNKN